MSDDADDGDEVALDGGAAAQVDADDDLGAAATETIVRGRAMLGRQISDRTRELLKTGIAKMRTQAEANELVPALGDDQGAAPAASGGDPQPAAAQPVAPPLPQQPDPALVQRVLADHEAAKQREAKLAEREQVIAARERELDPLTDVRESYANNRVDAVKALLKQWGMAGSDDDMKAEVMDLVTELSAGVLGVPIDNQIRSRIDSRRALKRLDAYKANETRKAQELAQKQDQMRYNEWRGNTSQALHKEITKPESATSYPFLATDDKAGEIVLDVIEAAHKRDGTVLQWTEAAKRANDYMAKEASDWFAKRKHLLTAASTPGASVAARAAPTQGDPTSISRSRTLTNAASAAPQGAVRAPQAGEAGFSMQAHREQTKAKMRARLKQNPGE